MVTDNKHFITHIRVHIGGYIAHYNSCNKVYIPTVTNQIHRDAYHNHLSPIYTPYKATVESAACLGGVSV